MPVVWFTCLIFILEHNMLRIGKWLLHWTVLDKETTGSTHCSLREMLTEEKYL